MTAQTTNIPFIDLAAQQTRIRESIERRIKTVLDHGKYIMGPEVREAESKLSKYVGVKHCVTCASGTDALLMALMVYNIGPGDAVLTTPFTFISTAEVITLLGATPVFVDIDPRTFNIDPIKIRETLESETIKNADFRVKGIIPVDLFGQSADYDAITSIAREYNLFVLEDAAQSLGAEYKGQRCGAMGNLAATSFFPAKPLGCYGDGGAIFTNDDALAAQLLSIRVHGKGSDKYDNVRIGVNGRFDTLQAAILLAKLEIFDEEVTLRQQAAGRYKALLANVVDTPQVLTDCTSVWAQYSVLSHQRETLMANLKEDGIPTAIYYPKPLHLQTAYQFLNYREGDFPVSESIANRIFSLPMHPYLQPQVQEYIAERLKTKD